MDTTLIDKKAFVCGSTQGIGLSVAEELAILGASITLVARNEEKLKDVVASLSNNGNQTHNYIIADFSNPKTLKTAIDKHLNELNSPEILINNTGGPTAGQAIDATEDDFTQAFSNHLVCNQLLTKALVPGMKEKKYGRIINVISTSVKEPIAGLGVSNTIRGAVASWAKTLANELGPFGITVNNVLPGFTNTERLSSLLKNKAEKAGKTLEEINEQSKGMIPAGRFAKPQEIAWGVAFLASPAAAYINGINLPIDGGRLNCL